jgi:hypothetical protein
VLNSQILKTYTWMTILLSKYVINPRTLNIFTNERKKNQLITSKNKIKSNWGVFYIIMEKSQN